MKITELRRYQDKRVILRLHDGEVATVKVTFVDAEYEDIVVDIIGTNHPEKYKGPSNAAYVIEAADLASVEEISS
ncbi:MAG TPA: hypothetical protein VJQ50_04265 [Terriglobales bacterium]|nr:hypothetical protein [Terriglobales bacterium]